MNINAIIGLAVGLFVAAAILPGAIVAISNTTAYEGAPATVLIIVPILGVVAAVAVLLMILRRR